MEKISLDWYNNCIEEPVRELVKTLRNGGINTTCSCGHEMFIEGYYRIDEDLMFIHDTIYNYLVLNNLPVDYKIVITHEVRDGYITQTYFRIKFGKEER